MARLLPLLLLASLASCSNTIPTVRERFARQYRCNEDSVEVEDLTGDSYRARGCRREAIYHCTTMTECTQERTSGGER